jgi:copper(I)-binding protein
VNRFSWQAGVAAVIVAVLGVAGLVRGNITPSSAAAGNTGANPIVVVDPFVRPPVPPGQEAAAYFTVYNTTSAPDTLESVSTGAGGVAELHDYVNGVMTAISGGVTIAAHGSLVLSVGKGHVMISQLFGTLKPGQTVNLELVFANAGTVDVVAPVVGFGQPIPGSTSSGSTATEGSK